MEPHTRPVVLILADISGYTQFMIASQEALVHGQMLITELLEAIIDEIEIPIVVKEIEGDAVFFYAIKPEDDADWDETRRLIGNKLVAFFDAFARTILEYSESAQCPCSVCRNIDRLKLKIVVHSGEALFHKIERFAEVSGVDVILAHRLLKNSIPSDEYVLMTESAYSDIHFPSELEVTQGTEHYEGFGAITTYAYLTEGASAPSSEQIERYYADRGRAFVDGLRAIVFGYFGQFPILLGLQAPVQYVALDAPAVRPLFRAGLALGLVLLAPLVLPYLVIVHAHRIVARRTLARRRGQA